MKKVIFVLGACVALCTSSCKKTDLVSLPTTQSKRLVTTPGTPEGTATSKLINAAAGGSINSADGRISISIPAGALAANETITIQPLTNNTGFGIGKTYRITPHEITFTKPVSISFKYTAEEVAATNPDFLTIGFRDHAGAWQAMNRTSVNKQTKH